MKFQDYIYDSRAVASRLPEVPYRSVGLLEQFNEEGILDSILSFEENMMQQHQPRLFQVASAISRFLVKSYVDEFVQSVQGMDTADHHKELLQGYLEAEQTKLAIERHVQAGFAIGNMVANTMVVRTAFFQNFYRDISSETLSSFADQDTVPMLLTAIDMHTAEHTERLRALLAWGINIDYPNRACEEAASIGALTGFNLNLFEKLQTAEVFQANLDWEIYESEDREFYETESYSQWQDRLWQSQKQLRLVLQSQPNYLRLFSRVRELYF